MHARAAVADRGARKRLLLLTIGATVLLYVIPFGRFVAYPLLLLSTLAHELGHGITAALTGARFDSFQMWFNGSGLARWTPNMDTTRADVALTGAGGLVGPAIVAAICFVVARRDRAARIAFGAMALLLVVAEILVVRNAFGLVFVGLVAVAFGAIALKASASFAKTALVFVAVQLSLAVFSRSDYLFKQAANTGAGTGPSDVKIMEIATGVPYWVWGLACGLFSVAILAAGAFLYVREAKPPAPKVSVTARS
jgi:hypothetical protein